MNVRFETGLKFFISALSSDGFFSSGVMIACFCDVGKQPSRNEALIIAVTYGSSGSNVSFSRNVGIGSSVTVNQPPGQTYQVLHGMTRLPANCNRNHNPNPNVVQSGLAPKSNGFLCGPCAPFDQTL